MSPGWEWPKQLQYLEVRLCSKFFVSTLVPCPGSQVLGTRDFPELVVGKADFRCFLGTVDGTLGISVLTGVLHRPQTFRFALALMNPKESVCGEPMS